MNSNSINIARDFSKYPAGRYKSDGPYSGELCRVRLFVPALKKSDKLLIELDGTRGYGSSFLEEAFGGLVRVEGFAENDLKSRIELKSFDESLIQEIWGYIGDAQRVQTTN